MFVCKEVCEKAFLKGKQCLCEAFSRSRGRCEICGDVGNCVDHKCYKNENKNK